MRKTSEALLLAFHDLELVLEVCDRVMLIDNGAIVTNGNPREVMGDVALMEAHGLERPHSLTPHTETHHGREQ